MLQRADVSFLFPEQTQRRRTEERELDEKNEIKGVKGGSRGMWRHGGVEVEGEMSFRGPGMLNISPCDPCIMDSL